MRFCIFICAWLGLIGAAHAQGMKAALNDCLPAREMRAAVTGRDVVPPAAAVVTARRQLPNADVVRANLCRNDKGFFYVITALRKDGRIVQVTVDGASGRVTSVQ
jgi:uncharacterized membrane protein YkoI